MDGSWNTDFQSNLGINTEAMGANCLRQSRWDYSVTAFFKEDGGVGDLWRPRQITLKKDMTMKTLWELLDDSYAAPDGGITSDVFTSVAVTRGSASDRQLSLIETLSGGSGDRLAEIRFGKSLMELDSAEASAVIQSLLDS